MNINKRKPWLILPALLLSGVAISSWAQMEGHMAHHAEHAMPMSHADHARHLAMMNNRHLKISQHRYTVPDVELRDSTGQPVALDTLLKGEKPVAVNFIFATCTTICPIMSATFAQMRRELGAEADRIRLVSITIDPEHDTPAVLSQYAKRYHAPAQWHFLTGKPKDIEKVLRLFDAWTGTKTNHRPITLLHKKGDNTWTRVEGLASGTALAAQARSLFN